MDVHGFAQYEPAQFFFFKREILLIQNSNILHLITETKVIKTLQDDIAFMLIARINDLRPTQLPKIPKIEAYW